MIICHFDMIPVSVLWYWYDTFDMVHITNAGRVQSCACTKERKHAVHNINNKLSSSFLQSSPQKMKISCTLRYCGLKTFIYKETNIGWARMKNPYKDVLHIKFSEQFRVDQSDIGRLIAWMGILLKIRTSKH